MHCIVSMRSQSALMVLPYDLILFTLLHEVAAASLGCPLGTYVHVSNSFHVYADEAALMQRVLVEEPLCARPMPAMPPDSLEHMPRVLEAEMHLRTRPCDDKEARAIAFSDYQLPRYWNDFLRTIASARAGRRPGEHPEQSP